MTDSSSGTDESVSSFSSPSSCSAGQPVGQLGAQSALQTADGRTQGPPLGAAHTHAEARAPNFNQVAANGSRISVGWPSEQAVGAQTRRRPQSVWTSRARPQSGGSIFTPESGAQIGAIGRLVSGQPAD